MTKGSLRDALFQIVHYFQTSDRRVYTRAELFELWAQNRVQWALPASLSASRFLEFLLDGTELREVRLPFPNRPEVRFTWGEVPLLSVLETIGEEAYFSHSTAMHIHHLTDQPPPTIYVNSEQRPHKRNPESLTQSSLDNAFRAAARTSSNFVQHGAIKIFLISGMSTGRLGVIRTTTTYGTEAPATVWHTDLERTLIDIVVRPQYAGGVASVAAAFARAKGRAQASRLVELLAQLSYVYPIHQAVGYYLERAGYGDGDLTLLHSIPQKLDFYLENRIKEPVYVPGWRLFVPKALKE